MFAFGLVATLSISGVASAVTAVSVYGEYGNTLFFGRLGEKERERERDRGTNKEKRTRI